MRADRSGDPRAHVVFVHQTFSNQNLEGSGRANAMAAALCQAGYRVSIIAGANSYLTGYLPPEYRGRWLVREEVDGYAVIRPWTYAKLHRSFVHRAVYFVVYMATSFLAILRLPRFTIVVGCSPPITVAFAAWLAAAVRRATFVFEVRDLWPAFPIQMGVIRNPILIGISHWVERHLYRRADSIVINSPGFLPHLREQGVDSAKVTLVANGVDIETFRPMEADEALRQSLGLAGRFVVVYVGAHGPANALEVLISAARILQHDSRIHVLLIGDGKAKASLVASASGLPNVTFVEPQPKRDIPRYIALANLGFLSLQNIPMFTTTYPNKVFDYLACGRPVLTTVDGVSRKVVEEANAGVYVAHEPQAIADAIVRAANHPSELLAMGRRGRAAAEQFWNREIFTARFVQLIDRLAVPVR